MRIVLHICCGVCAPGAFERLSGEGHQVLGFFYNPNIHPEAEYQKRLAAARMVAHKLDFPFEAPPFTPQDWSAATGPLGDEPEGGRRCEICFRIRLEKTCLYMKDWGYDAFTTTLTISPHKSADVINRVGVEIGGDRFLVRDFKKKDGFKQTIEMAKKWGLYRQDYCGCAYSMQGKR
ncbi:MAG: epoxyqueuosine reductase QueH [Dehalococcoidales bacterium]|nr:epoxyqueuosine reductase QueH [Dehalococcoidales bacterium]